MFADFNFSGSVSCPQKFNELPTKGVSCTDGVKRTFDNASLWSRERSQSVARGSEQSAAQSAKNDAFSMCIQPRSPVRF